MASQFNVVADDFVWEEGVEIGNFVIIEPDVKIGKGTKIKNYVEIRAHTTIGENCYIDSYVAVSGDAVIGDKVTLRYGVIIARGCTVGDNCYLAPRVMTNNLDADKNAVGGARIGRDCFIGTHAVLQHGIEIGNNVTIGAASLVLKDCTEDATYVGIPARKLVEETGNKNHKSEQVHKRTVASAKPAMA